MVWKIAFQKYRQAIISRKTIIIVYVLIFLWEDIVKRMLNVAARGGCSIGILEPYIFILTDRQNILILSVLFLVLLYDYPDVNGQEKNVLYRVEKDRWQHAQIIYTVWLACTVLVMAFLAFWGGVFRQAIWTTRWSTFNTTLYMNHQELYQANNQLFLDADVVSQGCPVEVAIHSTMLTLLLFAMIGQIVFFFSLLQKKGLGRGVVVLVLLVGWVAMKFEFKIQWLFPVSHVLYGTHFTTFLSKTRCDLWVSYVYFAILNLVWAHMGRLLMKRGHIW